MGDVAMTVPVLLAFAKAYPDIKITLLTKAYFKFFFDDVPNVQVKSLEHKGTHRGVWGLRKLYKELKAEGVDAVADLHDVLRSNILKRFYDLAKVPFAQIDKGRKEKKALTREKDKVFEALTPTHERYAKVFEQLGFPITLNASDVLPKRNIDSQCYDLIGNTPHKWIGFAPFAKHEGKQYPLDRSLQLIQEMAKKPNCKILLFGGGATEVQLLDKLAENVPTAINLAGKLNMRQELDIISNLDAMIAMDSGNGHMAAMFGKPVITIWGVTHPYAGFVPFAQPQENQILPDLEAFPLIPTSVFGNKYPDGYEKALKSILPETVLERLEVVLGE